MLYRRKLLLALVEMCGGSVKVADCQAYVAQFCERRQKNYYDFFPSPYGSYSLVLAYDKRRLTDLGLFEVQKAFQLVQKHSYLDQLRLDDQHLLQTIIADSVSEQQCERFSDHFSPEEETSAERSLDNGQTQEQFTGTPCLFTLGYEGLSIDAYLKLLINHGVALLVDVRKNPFSRKYGFSKKQLLHATGLAGIEYRHLPALGVPSDMRQQLDTEMAYNRLFEHYANHILPNHLEAIEQIKRFLLEAGHIALTCFEADPQFCHRHKITEYLTQNEPEFHAQIIHLRAENRISTNSMNYPKRKNVRGQESKDSIYIPI